MSRIMSKKKIPYFSIVLIMVLLIVAGLTVAPDTVVEPMTRTCIFILFAMSTNILMGYMGLMPLGQSLFIGISAYSYTILLTKYGMTIFSAILLSLLITVILAFVVGYLCLRKGEGFANGFIYLGLNTLFQLICQKSQYMGFEGGLNGAKRISFFSEGRPFLVLTILVVGVLYILIYRIMHSPTAKVIQGIRENSERVTYLGIDVFRFKLLIFIISGTLMGIGGILYSMFLRGAYPNMCNNNVGLQCMIMCMIGGMSYFYGPTTGAIIGTWLFSQLSNITLYWQGVTGIILVICVLFFRDGIFGFIDLRLNTRKKKNGKQRKAEVE